MEPVADQFPITPVRQTIYMERHYPLKFPWDGSRYRLRTESNRFTLLNSFLKSNVW